MSATRLKELQQQYVRSIDDEVQSWFDRVGMAGPFAGMMRYQLGYVDESLRPVNANGGKRFRPLLCLLACEALCGNWEGALTLAAGIELLHNFSLIHDDIEDSDPARRHRATVWKVWGEPHAINVGDGMFALSGRCISEAAKSSHLGVRLVREFQDTSLLLTEGQYLDMSFETRDDVSPEEYMAMIARKTAALVGFSLWSGAAAAGAEEQTAEKLRGFGYQLGQGFQIHDDVMGIWGSPDATGKEAAKDVKNRKKTLPLLLALEYADPAGRTALRRFLARESEDVEEVLAVISSTPAREISRQRADSLLSSALESLRDAIPDATRRASLEALARELVA